MSQLVQIAGAVLVLAAFVATQQKLLRPHTLVYLVTNLAGSALLAAVALHQWQWGFLLLEGTWAAVSASGVLRLLAERLTR